MTRWLQKAALRGRKSREMEGPNPGVRRTIVKGKRKKDRQKTTYYVAYS